MSNTANSKDTIQQDNAGVAFDPRHLLTISIILGFALRWLVPLEFVSGTLFTLAGAAITLAAFGLFFWAGATMHNSNTPVPADEPTTPIVEQGPFRFSRNPTYLAILLLHIGVGIWANSLWFLGLAALSAMLLSWGVISREEQYLEQKFGADYLSYKGRVRRWI